MKVAVDEHTNVVLGLCLPFAHRTPDFVLIRYVHTFGSRP